MANPNAPFGFEPFKVDGKEVRVKHYVKKTGNAIYPGDLVILTASGDVDIAATTGTVLGVAAEYKAATDVSKIAVYDDPMTEFIAQATTFAAADVGQNACWVVGTPDATLKKSGGNIDAATNATTATLQVKLLGLLERGDNAVGSYAIVRCKLNNHVFVAGVAGI